MIFTTYVFATVGLILMTISAFVLLNLYKRAGWPNETKAWNCWAFAYAKWLEQDARKTYLVVRLSKHGPIPHVMFAKSISGLFISEMMPIHPKKGWRAIIDSVKFQGKVREGKGEK